MGGKITTQKEKLDQEKSALGNQPLHLGIKAYSPTSLPEVESIDWINNNLDKKLVRPHINAGDKIPNHDGNLDVLNRLGQSYGELKIQVKTLNEGDFKRKGFNCERSLLNYAKTCMLPFVLIGVSSKNDSAIWVHIDKHQADTLLKELSELGQDSITIKFPDVNFIGKNGSGYYEPWVSVIDEHRKYAAILDKRTTVQEAHEKIRKVFGDFDAESFFLKGDDLKEVQAFLDYYNKFLRDDYGLVKTVYFPNVWEFGIACANYSENHIEYCLYPINIAGIKIKQLTTDLMQELYDQGITFRMSRVVNPIKQNARSAAESILTDYLKKIIQDDLYVVPNSEWLIEYIFQFAERNKNDLGLDNKSAYSLDEIKQGLDYFYLYQEKFWEFANKKRQTQKQNTEGNSTDDLRYVSVSFDGNEIGSLKLEVQAAFSRGERCTFKTNIVSNNDSYQRLEMCVKSAEGLNINEVSKLYLGHKYSDKELADHILRVELSYLESLKQLVRGDFKSLKDHIKDIISGKIVIFIDKNRRQLNYGCPNLEILKLTPIDAKVDGLDVHILSDRSEMDALKKMGKENDEFIYLGGKYSLVSEVHSTASFHMRRDAIDCLIKEELRRALSVKSSCLDAIRRL